MKSANLENIARILDQQISQARALVRRRMSGESIEDFDIRGDLYATAMGLAPNARIADLRAMKRWLHLRGDETIIDVAAGGGFLTERIRSWTTGDVFAMDPSRVQLGHLLSSCEGIRAIVGSPDDNQVMAQLPNHSVDVMTSFGGIHHVHDQQALMLHASRVLKIGGRFVAADVCADTPLSSHFDEVTSRKSITGHTAKWLSSERLDQYVQGLPLHVVRTKMVPLRWFFTSEREMALFFRGLHAYDIPESEILADLNEVLGYGWVDGRVHLNWEMLFFEIKRI